VNTVNTCKENIYTTRFEEENWKKHLFLEDYSSRYQMMQFLYKNACTKCLCSSFDVDFWFPWKRAPVLDWCCSVWTWLRWCLEWN